MAGLCFTAADVALEVVSMITEGVDLVKMLQAKIVPPFEGTQDTAVGLRLGMVYVQSLKLVVNTPILDERCLSFPVLMMI